MRARSRARGWALQILYAWEARETEMDPLRLLHEFLAERTIAPDRRQYVSRLIRTVAGHRAEIDERLGEALTNWRIDRLAVIDRNILRIAAAELLHIPEVPSRVSIQEAILLAEKYGTAESPRFVNGVLDALRRTLEEPAANAGEAGS